VVSAAVRESVRSKGRPVEPSAQVDRFARLLRCRRPPGVRFIRVADRSAVTRTRVLDECKLLASGHGLPVVRGRAVKHSVPYGIFAAAFEHAMADLDSVAELGQDAILLLGGLFRSLCTQGWAREALGVSDAGHHRLHRAVRTTIEAMFGPVGVVFVFDNLHQADERSLALLDYLVRRVPRTPLLLVLAHDPSRSVPLLIDLLAEAERRSAVEQSVPVVDLPADRGRHRLTERELTVLAVLAEGLTAHAIARELGISPRTVHRHLQHLYRKLGTTDRLATVLRAKSLGLLP